MAEDQTSELQTHIPTLFHYLHDKSGFAFNQPTLFLLFKEKIYSLNTEEVAITSHWRVKWERLIKGFSIWAQAWRRTSPVSMGRDTPGWGSSTAKMQGYGKGKWQISQIPWRLTLMFPALINWWRVGVKMMNLVWGITSCRKCSAVLDQYAHLWELCMQSC